MEFSKSIEFPTSENFLHQALEDKKRKGILILDLTVSNPTQVGFEYEIDQILSAYSNPESLNYAPHPLGLIEARKAVADYYRSKKVNLSSEHMVLTSGTSEAYSLLFKILASPGDTVLIPEPGYPLMAHLAGFEHLRPLFYPLYNDPERGWGLDLNILENLVTPDTKALVVISPHNPTGHCVTFEEARAVDRICETHKIALIVDEVFSDFRFHSKTLGPETLLGKNKALTFVLNGFSKTLGLPQLKLAWIAVSGAPEDRKRAVERLGFLMDFFLTVSTPVQKAAPDLLGLRRHIQAIIRERLETNRKFLAQSAAPFSNITLPPVHGGWYAPILIADKATDEERALQLLKQEDILIHPGWFYDFSLEGFIVVSLLTRPDILARGISTIFGRYGRA